MGFDFAKRNRPAQRFNWSEINSGPVPFLRSRISVCSPNNFRDPRHSLVLAAVIEKDFIALLHPAKVVSGGVITHAGPTGLSFGDKIRPRVGGWFLFHEPETFHRWIVIQETRTQQTWEGGALATAPRRFGGNHPSSISFVCV